MTTAAGFCARCGKQRRSPVDRFCGECGADARSLAGDPSAGFCPTCGTQRQPEATECSQCGHSFGGWVSDAEREVAEPSSLEVSYYQTATWMLVLLCLVTAGLYLPIWMGITWSEMKRVYRDVRMYPIWHGLSVLVPVYGWMRFYEHCVAINYVVQHTGGVTVVRSGRATIALVIGSAAGFASAWTIEGLFILLWLLSSGLFAATLVHAQRGLNHYRSTLSKDETPVAVRGWEWGLLFFGSIFIMLALFAALPEK